VRLSREQSREVTRDRLRISAIREISVSGFSGASIDRICDSAGFSRGAFYANFKNKEDLLLDIMRSFHDREAESWIRLINSELSLAELMPALRDRFAEYLADEDRVLFSSEVMLYVRRNREFLARYYEEYLAITLRAEKVLEAIYQKADKLPHRPLGEVAALMRGLFAGVALDSCVCEEKWQSSSEVLVVFLEDMLALARGASG